MSEMGTLFLSSSSQHLMGELGAREAPTTPDWPVPVWPIITMASARWPVPVWPSIPMASARWPVPVWPSNPMACACLAEQPDACACLADHPDGPCLSVRASRWPVPAVCTMAYAYLPTNPMASACLCLVHDGLCLPGALHRNLSKEISDTISGWHCPTFRVVQGVCQLSREDVNLTTLDVEGTDIVSVQLTTYG